MNLDQFCLQEVSKFERPRSLFHFLLPGFRVQAGRRRKQDHGCALDRTERPPHRPKTLKSRHQTRCPKTDPFPSGLSDVESDDGLRFADSCCWASLVSCAMGSQESHWQIRTSCRPWSFRRISGERLLLFHKVLGRVVQPYKH